MNIVFDLDGTLLDSKQRLYQLFQHLVPVSRLTYTEYWKLKQSGIPHEKILAGRFAFKESDVTEFTTEWMGLIESPDFLALDSAIPGMREALIRLKERANLYVCTARQSRAPVLGQLEQSKLLPFFEQVLVTEGGATKDTLIDRCVPGRTKNDWILGDTGKDIQTGKLLDMNTCGVLSGFLNEVSLTSYNPDLILASATDFKL